MIGYGNLNLQSLRVNFFVLACFFSSQLQARTSRDESPRVKSQQAIVMLWPSGTVVYEKDADTVRPIASLSKVMSAIVLEDSCKLDPDGLHEMSVENRIAAKGGDHSKLTTGWLFRHEDLLYAALMRSDNRALPALVEACQLSISQFAARMNAKARSLGLTKTNFYEPNGLSAENVSTAREYARILQELENYPNLVNIMQTESHRITGYRNGVARTMELRNTDRLLKMSKLSMVGGKTGYTDLARYCFAGLAKLTDQVKVMIVLLNSEGKLSRFADFTRIHQWVVQKKEALFSRLAGDAKETH